MKKSYLSRKDSIILSAIEIIDELGINELSIRELASRQGVSEPALYRHFTSKQDIILGILDYYSSFDDMILNTILNKELDAKDGIRFFVKAYAENLENYPPLTALSLCMDGLGKEEPIVNKSKDILSRRYNFITNLIERDIQSGKLNSFFASSTLADLIFGSANIIVYRWRVGGFSFQLKETIMNTVESILMVC